ncbi:hypothetical protein R3P38DRAFT_3229495 [Favolaschia claudopus]|uniref:Uncharacterized protein n=1 Tax=Favolaschia claudopus TaxID=2862362 RepID=A0AAV9ZP91_9AGAR
MAHPDSSQLADPPPGSSYFLYPIISPTTSHLPTSFRTYSANPASNVRPISLRLPDMVYIIRLWAPPSHSGKSYLLLRLTHPSVSPRDILIPPLRVLVLDAPLARIPPGPKGEYMAREEECFDTAEHAGCRVNETAAPPSRRWYLTNPPPANRRTTSLLPQPVFLHCSQARPDTCSNYDQDPRPAPRAPAPGTESTPRGYHPDAMNSLRLPSTRRLEHKGS